MLRLLTKARPAVAELHGQGIGCPDCFAPDPEGSEYCPFLREIEVLLTSLERK